MYRFFWADVFSDQLKYQAVAPGAGFKPATIHVTGGRSTVELPGYRPNYSNAQGEEPAMRNTRKQSRSAGYNSIGVSSWLAHSPMEPS